MKKKKNLALFALLLAAVMTLGLFAGCDMLPQLGQPEEFSSSGDSSPLPQDTRSLTPEEHRLQSFEDRIPLEECPICGGTKKLENPLDWNDAEAVRPKITTVQHFDADSTSPSRENADPLANWSSGSNDLTALADSDKEIDKIIVQLDNTALYTHHYNDYDGTPAVNPSNDGLMVFKVTPGTVVCPHMANFEELINRDREAGDVSYFYTDSSMNLTVNADSGFNKINTFYIDPAIVQSTDDRGMVDYTGYNGNTTGLPTNIPQLNKGSEDTNSWSDNNDVELSKDAAAQFSMLLAHDYTVKIYYKDTAPQTVTISYDGNGSTGGTAPAAETGTVGNGTTAKERGNLERSGYTFVNWNSSADGSGTAYAPGDPITYESDITLFAQWKQNATATVTFELNGGRWNAANIDPSATIQVGNKIPEPSPAPSKDSNGFGGWFKDAALSSAWNFASDTVSGNMTLYAKWTPAKLYTVHFDSTGGTELEPTENVASGSKIKKPTDPKWTGREFDGWYLDKEYTSPWNFDSSTVTSDITLYAKWLADEYTVKFDSLGGSTVEEQKVKYREGLTEPKDPTREGYVFGGWYTDKDVWQKKWDFANSKVESDLTLYAQWGNETHTVRFSTGDGGSAIADITGVAFNSAIKEPAAPSRDGYTFGGWYKDAALSNRWDFKKDTVTADMTLYAAWNRDTFTVRFNPSNGGDITTIENVPGGSTIQKPNNPTYEGYVFGGWYKDTASTMPWDFARDTVTGDTTLYAKWTEEVVAKPEGPSIQIGDSNIPLFPGSGYTGWSLFNLIVASVSLILSLIVVVMRVVQSRDSDAPRDKKYTAFNLIAMLTAVLLILLTLLTGVGKDIMIIFNGWSIVMAPLLAFQIVAMIISNRMRKEN